MAATKCRSIELVSECPAHGIFAAGENRSAGAFVQIPTRGGAGMAVYRTVADKQSKIHIGQGVFDSVFGQGFAGGQAGGGVCKTRLDYARFGRSQTRKRVDARRCQSGRTYGFAEYVRGKKASDAQRTYDRYAVRQRKNAFLYKKTYKLFEKLRENFGSDIKWLSMGMSVDYLTAIENGSNMIRPGRALFGERFYAT